MGIAIATRSDHHEVIRQVSATEGKKKPTVAVVSIQLRHIQSWVGLRSHDEAAATPHRQR